MLRAWIYASAISTVICLAACSQQTASKPPTTKHTEYMTHTVAYQGETLAMIASWYTGSAKNWQVIQDYNPGLDVRRMRIGSTVQIPVSMVVKNKPMPRPAVNLQNAQQATRHSEQSQSDASPASQQFEQNYASEKSEGEEVTNAEVEQVEPANTASTVGSEGSESKGSDSAGIEQSFDEQLPPTDVAQNPDQALDQEPQSEPTEKKDSIFLSLGKALGTIAAPAAGEGQGASEGTK